MVRQLVRPKTEDLVLPESITNRFIEDLNNVLDTCDDLRSQYLKKYWLQKFCRIDTKSTQDRRSRAIEKWLRTETLNSITNRRLSSEADTFLFSERVTFNQLLRKARAFVRSVLFVPPSYCLSHGGFSGGATTSRTRLHGHPAMKFSGKADATRPAYEIWFALNRGTRWADHWDENALEACFVPGNVLFTVPKNAEIDRVACKEPDLNIFLQKSLGNQIRTLLRRQGVNLNDQSVNGDLARRASIDGRLSTIDLSSASDSVCTELVRRLLPPDWFNFMEAIRSPTTEIDGVLHVNEMFSSMGNGFTFELESLIFYALTRAVAYFEGVRGTISVYGDDIIAPVEIVPALKRAFAFCGFTMNADKTFYDGPFRESCGTYWHNGIDVKPFYLKGPLHRISDLILVLNQLIGWASCGGVVDPRFEGLFYRYKEYIPEKLHGGQDLTSRTSLVTGDRPRKVLVPVTKIRSHNHIGGLLFWLFLAWNRLGYVEEPLIIRGSSNTGYSRCRKNLQPLSATLPVFPDVLRKVGGPT